MDEVKDHLDKAGIKEAESGSVLALEKISPDEMAYLLKNDKKTSELLSEAIEGKASGAVKGGASVIVTGMKAELDTSSEDILKMALTPTEIVEMLSSAKTIDVVLELKENKEETGETKTAKEEIAKRIGSDEDAYYFDCDLYKMVSGSADRIKVTEFDSEINISFTIPDEFQKKGRTYRLIGSHKDVATGVMSSYVIPSEVDDKYVISFVADKLCLMSLVYTDDDIKAGNAAAREAAEREAVVKAAAEKEAANKQEQEKLVKAKEELDKKLADAIKSIEGNAELDATAKAAAKKTVEEEAASAKKELDSKGSGAQTSVNASFDNALTKAIEDGKSETRKRADSTVTPDQQETNNLAINKGLKIDQTGSKIRIAWGKVDGAENYDVYVQYCGKQFIKVPDKTLKSNKTKVTITKIGGKKLNLKKNYKVYVIAYRTVDGEKITLAKTITGHIVGRKNTKFTNVKSIKLSKSKYTVKVGKTAAIKAKTVLVDKGRKQLSDAHAAEFRYATSDKRIATVDKNGKIKGVSAGNCTIYVYARNGYAKTVKVTVK